MILRRMTSAIISTQSMGHGPMPTLDPFLFCVYHKDNYPADVTGKMETMHRGDGSDFDPNAEYRMYHGEKVPGFPQHPHRGFETITATIDGVIDHADSLGNAGRYGYGDLQWMTAGKGCVHSEMFPLIQEETPNPTRFFQIWINLPKASKMVDPGFAMFWADQVPSYETEDKLAKVTLWAGNDYFGVTDNNAPPSSSWAAKPENDVAVWHITIQPGGVLELPKAHAETCNRSIFFIEGSSTKLNEIDLKEHTVLQIKSDESVTLTCDVTAECANEFLLLQGRPIDEPVAQYGPFVMNSRSEIEQAFMDYQQTRFGGWPWDRDDMIFPREKGRFALNHGIETHPEDTSTCHVAIDGET